jgi:tryptophanase
MAGCSVLGRAIEAVALGIPEGTSINSLRRRLHVYIKLQRVISAQGIPARVFLPLRDLHAVGICVFDTPIQPGIALHAARTLVSAQDL